MIDNSGFERRFGVSHVFIKRDDKGEIIMFISKLTDDLLMAGDLSVINWITVAIKYDSR